MKWFLEFIKPAPEDTVLDVGGSPNTWIDLTIQSRITLLNVYPVGDVSKSGGPQLQSVLGDGCDLKFPDRSFDIVFSNSVIEHVGTFQRQQAFARECRRVAGKLWVQTPARSFFMEPHLLTPFIHFFPIGVRRKLLRNFTLWGLITRPTAKQVEDFLAEVRLLGRQEMRDLFPDCEIRSEKFMGFTKSYIAVRDGRVGSQ